MESMDGLTFGPIIKMIRSEYLNPPMTQKEFAEGVLNIGRAYLASMERERKVPSQNIIERIAMEAGRNPTDRAYLLRALRLGVIRFHHPGGLETLETEIRESAATSRNLFFLPHEIQAIINENLFQKGLVLEDIAEQMEIPVLMLRAILAGTSPIKKIDLMKLAEILGENANDWLLFCGYIPTDVSKSIKAFFAKNKNCTTEDLINKINK